MHVGGNLHAAHGSRGAEPGWLPWDPSCIPCWLIPPGACPLTLHGTLILHLPV